MSAQILDARDSWLRSFHSLAATVRAAWGADTAWVEDWCPHNPARGQCGTSSLILQDERGGTLERGYVETPGCAGRMTVHYWNRFEPGRADLTWQQFATSSRVVHGERVAREQLLANPWLTERYRTLRARLDNVGG
jgi:hypothetical protein